MGVAKAAARSPKLEHLLRQHQRSTMCHHRPTVSKPRPFANAQKTHSRSWPSLACPSCSWGWLSFYPASPQTPTPPPSISPPFSVHVPGETLSRPSAPQLGRLSHRGVRRLRVSDSISTCVLAPLALALPVGGNLVPEPEATMLERASLLLGQWTFLAGAGFLVQTQHDRLWAITEQRPAKNGIKPDFVIANSTPRRSFRRPPNVGPQLACDARCSTW
jgi:hypothetical protein